MDIKYYFWLDSVKGLGKNSAAKLISHFGGAGAVYKNCDLKTLSFFEDINESTAEALCARGDLSCFDEAIDELEKKKTKYLTFESPSYPKMLKEIFDPPLVLYYKGENLFKEPNISIAMVGARKSNFYGNQMAEELAYRLAGDGVTVVSGLAKGIDRYSHEGALKAGGRTIGVLGNGIDVVYPKENSWLFDKILDNHGMIISELSPSQEPAPWLFPNRNRIISGLCFGTVVVQAAKNSGSLITARLACEQGREVYAVPGEATSPLSDGTNKLIKDGAKLVTCSEDILEDLYHVIRPVVKQEKLDKTSFTNEENAVLNAVLSGIQTPDTLCTELKMTAAQINALLTVLEIKRAVIIKMGVVYATYRR